MVFLGPGSLEIEWKTVERLNESLLLLPLPTKFRHWGLRQALCRQVFLRLITLVTMTLDIPGKEPCPWSTEE